ncbi:MAG: autotransporter outer membrane beta-barrel domain-containing protein [Xanthobacteraceae bacterium]
MQDFLNLLLDPSADGQGGGAGGQVSQFAPEQDSSLPPDIALAYAHALRQKPPPSAQPRPQDFEQRWSAWASGFGGSGTTDGNASAGSNNVTATDYGYAAGLTYHLTPATSYGFALAGGGTNWNLAQSLGSGRSDSFQSGVYSTTHFGPAYLSGALAFANHWFTTNRIAMGDNLTANFQGQSYAARGEAGYRYGLPITGTIVGVTPYAALQVQDFHTPSYSETDLSGGGFGLTYNAVNATDTRSELGARFDNLTVWNGMPLVLRGRLAWAHDWVSDPALGAAFQALPGSSFTVNGAAPPKNSALTTAGAELHLSANWTAMAKFDGEFGAGSQTYAGTGTLKYSW